MSSIPLRPERGLAPLSYAQEAMWRAERALPGTALHNEAAAFRLRGPVNPDALAQALQAATARFELLRGAITEDAEGRPRHCFSEATRPPLTRVDLRSLPPREREERLSRLMRRCAAKPFDLNVPPLLRTDLFTLAAEECVLQFTAHHLIADAWALGLFLDAVSEAYTAVANAADLPLTASPAQPDFGDYACWQRSDPDIGRDLEYWRGRLSGDLAAVTLPGRLVTVGGQRDPADSVAGRVHRLTMPADLVSRLRDVGRANLGSLASVVLTLLCSTLRQFTGSAEMVIGIPAATRNRSGLSSVVGPLLNILACPVRLAGSASFAAALQGVRDELKASLHHRDTPFDLVRQLTGNATPFNVMYAFHGGSGTNLHLPAVSSAPLPVHSGTAKYDLTLFARPRESGDLDLDIEYRTGRLTASTVEACGDALICLAHAAAEAPGRTLADLLALTGEERHRIVAGFNPPEGRWTSIGISEQLRTRSVTNRGTVSGAVHSLSFAEVDNCADRVARRLSGQHHVPPGARVALRMRRDAYLIPVIVGIWRAGATLVPLDAVGPARRASYMVRDSKASLLIVDDQEGAAGIDDVTLASVGELVKPDEVTAVPPGRPPHPEPDAPAYLMYTSGSTGDPKGVIVPHRCLAALVSAMTDALRIGMTDVLVAVTSIAFDISMLELFAPLLAGGRVVIASQEASHDPRSVAGLLDEAQATIMQATPSLWRAMLEAGWHAGQELRALSGGEPLDPALAGRLLSSCAEVWNLYGPTETTVWSTAGRMQPGEPVTVGTPIAGTYCYVLSADDQPVPCGAVGELVIGGAGVSDGYWGRPELTAASFVPDPVRPGTGTVYRTGDRAQYLPDGRIALHGRADDQLKIRGHRIELGEVEALLSAHPQVRDAAVIVDRAAPEPRLVAFVVPRTAGAMLPRPELTGYLRARLSSAAVPAHFTTLDELPLNTSGKTDRPALARLTRPARVDVTADPPRTDAERAVAALWAEMTGAAVGTVGRSDDFLASGASSLAAMRLLGRVHATLGGPVSLADFYLNPTVAALTRLAGRGRAGSQGPGPAPVTGEAVPLTGQQRPLWLHHQMKPNSPAFHLAARIDLTGHVDPGALAEALRQLCTRHEVLAARCELRDAGPALVPQPGRAAALELADLRDVPAAQQPGRLAARASEEAVRPFELATGPLLRAVLVRTGDAAATLLLAAHHIAIDGWSIGIAVGELAALYRAGTGQSPAVTAAGPGYTCYAAAQAGAAQRSDQDRQLDYWISRLEGYSGTLELPTSGHSSMTAADQAQADSGGVFPANLSAGCTARLREVAARLRTTPFTLLLTAFACLLGRYGTTDDVVIGVPVANRDRPELDSVIGPLVNTLPVRVDLSGQASFAALAARTGQALVADLGMPLVPIDRLVSALALPRDLSRPALIQAVLVLQDAPPQVLDLGTASGVITPVPTQTAKYDLTLSLAEQPDQISGALEYSRPRLTTDFARRFTRDFRTLLQAGLANPEASLDRVDWPGGRLAKHREARRPSVRQAGRAGLVHEPFERHAGNRPGYEAIRYGAERVSYRQLDQWSTAVAAGLRNCGAGAFVAVLCPTGPTQVAAILGASRAGCAFVVLDPADGDHRLATVLADAAPACVLASDELVSAHPALCDTERTRLAGVPVVTMPAPSAAAPPGRRTSTSATPDAPLCLVYTSGSTGTPKGIVLSHASFAQFATWQMEAFGIGVTSRVAQWAPFTYDAAYTEVLAALSAGATLCIPPDAVRRDPVAMVAWLRDERVTQIQTVPAFFQLITDVLDTGGGALPDLRHVLLAGEALPVSLAARWSHRAGRPRLHNLYGPTECILATHRELQRGESFADSVPIGAPIAGREAVVLDHRGRSCPPNVTGEIYLRSDYLAAGYYRRPAETRQAFVPDPRRPGKKLYRTGDLGYYRADGELMFAGRRDSQVKIRGSRVELAEIEALLEGHPLVREAAAAVHREGSVVRLCGYAAASAETSGEALRAYLAERLPRPAVPDVVIIMDRIPRTRTNKRDRSLLPAPGAAAVPAEGSGPRLGTEQLVAAAWEGVLGHAVLGRDTNFFEAGGDSLLAARLQIELRRRLGREIRLVDLFARPTIAEFAAGLDAGPAIDQRPPPRGAQRREAMRSRASARAGRARAADGLAEG